MDHNIGNGSLASNKTSLLKIIIFEIFFVSLLISLLFMILGFFNVISLSKIFPQFSFLPHLKSSDSNIQLYLNSQIQSNYMPSHNLISSLLKQKKDFKIAWKIGSDNLNLNLDNNDFSSYHFGVLNIKTILPDVALRGSSSAATVFTKYFKPKIEINSWVCKVNTPTYALCFYRIISNQIYQFYKFTLLNNKNYSSLIMCFMPLSKSNVVDYCSLYEK